MVKSQGNALHPFLETWHLRWDVMMPRVTTAWPLAHEHKAITGMMEVALVFDKEGKTIVFHEPPGRTGGAIPDSRSLWEVLWENRANLGGVAHTHPWDGEARYSHTDVTTFRAIDDALGKNLLWPVVTSTDVAFYQWHPSFGGPLDYGRHATAPIVIEGIEELRVRSRNPR